MMAKLDRGLWLLVCALLVACGSTTDDDAHPIGASGADAGVTVNHALDAARISEAYFVRDLRASNAAQGFTVAFDDAAIRLEVGAEKHELSMRLAGVGRRGAIEPAPLAAEARMTENRVELPRARSITEWYVNAPDGLEQGFVFEMRPRGMGPLVVAIDLVGDVTAELASNGASIALELESGHHLKYSKLHVEDADGKVLPASMQVAGNTIELIVDDANASYPLRVDPTINQDQEIFASDGTDNDFFGTAIGMWDDTMVVGAPYDSGVSGTELGTAYVFTHDGTAWTEQQKLLAGDPLVGSLGDAVAVHEDTIVLGAFGSDFGLTDSGSALVFTRSGTAWSKQATLLADDPETGSQLGQSVDVYGDTAVVGAPEHRHAGGEPGVAYVFVRSGTTWTQQAELRGSGLVGNTGHGWSVAIHEDTIAVSAPFHEEFGQPVGAVHVFVRSGTTWTEQARLLPAEPYSSYPEYGRSIDVWGDQLVVGAPRDEEQTIRAGAAYFYKRSGTTWTGSKVFEPTPGDGHEFGTSVSAYSSTIAVAALSGGSGQGAVFMYTGGATSSSWTLEPGDLQPWDFVEFGRGMATWGRFTAAGAPSHWHNQPQEGAVYVFGGGNGTACTVPTGCWSGLCIDGVCCDTGCNTQCEACSAAQKGYGHDGVCEPIAAGSDPDGECPTEAATTCGFSGMCDGSGKCEYHAAGTVCVQQACSGSSTQANADTCDGSGNCVDNGATACSTGYACVGTGCVNSCADDSDCAVGYYCASDNSCQPQKAQGAVCDTTADCNVSGCRMCATGNCVDGVCCDTTCGGRCDVCAASLGASADGTCTPAPVGSTGSPTCSPYLCDGSDVACPTNCGTDSDCGSAYYCASDATCKLRKGQGAACNPIAGLDCFESGCRVCNSAACVDGYCCDTTCASACQTCGATPGTCESVTNAEDVPQCDGTDVCDASGACKKKLGEVCSLGSECVSGFCADGVCCASACAGGCDRCDNVDGECRVVSGGTGANPSCAPLLCDGVSPNCPGGCSSDADCDSSTYCSAAGDCLPRKAQGASCDDTAGADCLQGGCQVCGTAGGCVDGVCCDVACSGDCDVCAAALGASSDGTCTTAPDGYSGVPSCGAYVCDGSTTSCPTSCATDADCASTHYCASDATCKLQKRQGAVCDLAAGGDCLELGCRVCETGACSDGVCCDTACSEPCDVCEDSLGASADGTCTTLPATATGNPSCAPYFCSGTSAACGTGCSSDADCTAGSWCDVSTGSCQADQADGAACTSASQCGSGFCVDGVCCDTRCDGLCQACTNAAKGFGTDGVCGNVADGNDPRDDCADEGANSCGFNGSCNGQGACARYAQGVSCGATSCSGNTVRGRICNGSGTCVDDPVGVACDPYVCASGSCSNPCSVAADCLSGNYCDAGTCRTLKANGAACTTGAECASTQCVDGVCCNTSCAGPCQACVGTGTDGECGFIANGTDPDSECADEGADSCGQDGMCNGQGACRLYAQNTACGTTQCSNNQVLGQTCNGLGSCITNTTGVDCAPYACANGACAASCTSNAECTAGNFCDASGACVPELARAEACADSTQCASGFCVDGYCCDQACTDQCKACDVSGFEGSCTGVQGVPHGARPACGGGGDVCAGTCDGVSSSCVYPGSSELCGSQCSNATITVSTCDGKGACVEGTPDSCPGNRQCGTDTCLDTCTGDDDCVSGFRCSAGDCVPSTGKCVDNDTAVEDQDGEVTQCAPYWCEAGSCTDSCVSSNDCQTGFVCDTAQGQGTCIAASGGGDIPGDEDGGCGCRTADSRGGHTPWMLAMLLGGAMVMRRRRRRIA